MNLSQRIKIVAALLVAVLSLHAGSWIGLEEGHAASAGVNHSVWRRGDATVTLVTGDRVTVDSRGAAGSVHPAEGREKIMFATYHAGGDLYVVPRDAQPLVRAGKLDRRLFNVSELIRFGYDDARRGTLPLIITYGPRSTRQSVTSSLEGAGARVNRNLPAVRVAAVTVAKDHSRASWPTLVSGVGTTHAATFTKIWLDGKRQPSLDHSVPQIGAPTAWQAGYTGKGVSVGVLDSGVDATHPDLKGKVIEAHNFTDNPNPADTVGHGTHVVSIITGTGAASGGQYKGVAPDVSLFDAKVCDDSGCAESAILAGMQWAAADKHVTVANLSLGGPDTPDVDPLEAAINTLTESYGTLFVVAAGNAGPHEATVDSPGSADAALTVGAVNRADQLADFSSRGPRVSDDVLKPDITAPGVDIAAARAADTQLGEPVGDSYTRLSGTSMATPHVTGGAAILAQRHPDWTASKLKATLMASADPGAGMDAYQQGAGRIDVARAITQTVTGGPTSLSFGRQDWPHDDDQPITKTMSYHNAGSVDAVLDLTTRIISPHNVAVPAGMFRLSADRVTVPPGGQAQVTLTVDTRRGGPDGLYSGELLATGGGNRVSTPVGIHKDIEKYSLTITYRDRHGSPTGDYESGVFGTGQNAHTFLHDDSGTATVRLPKGRYDLFAIIYSESSPDASDQILMSQPLVELDRDLAITMDARNAEPVRMEVPDATARPALVNVGYDHHTAVGDVGAELLTDTFDGVYSAQQGPSLPRTQLVGRIGGQWVQRNAAGGQSSPYLYALTRHLAGGLPTGFIQRFHADDLAVVHSSHATTEPGMIGIISTSGRSPLSDRGWSIGLPMTLPATLTRYLNTDSLRWISTLDIGPPTDDGFPDIGMTLLSSNEYQAGRQYRERWNTAPFGPAFPAPAYPGEFITRRGDTLVVEAPLFSDAAGHSGRSRTEAARTTVYRDDVKIGEAAAPAGSFEIPPEAADYRVEVNATRTGFGGLTSEVSTVWTFRSGRVDQDNFVPLPVMAVRFTPQLNKNNQAAAGKFDIPVTVQPQASTPATTVHKLTVSASYDDGRTWRPATLRRTPGGWVATLVQPSTGYVSLRASVVDSEKNTVEQTTIHAYGLTAR
jgi:subtilisin family serine protease